MRDSNQHGWRAASLVLLVVVSGCAVQTTRTGHIQVGLDNAELLGQTLASFNLSDGSEGRLRVLGGKYSVKLQRQLKVVDIPNATMVRLVSASLVDGRTLVVLEKAERNCDYKTHLLSIQGAEVLIWDFGDCRTRPITSVQADQASFDFVQPQRTTRFTYRDARLMRGDFPTMPVAAPGTPPSPAAPAGPVNASLHRYVPGPPVAASRLAGGAGSYEAMTGSVTGGTSATPPARSPAPPRPTAQAPRPQPTPPTPVKGLDFPSQEQKPVRIVLDK
jgi:hypothetical protein